MKDVIDHYDKLVEENNDPVRDSEILRDYMDKWDGQDFIDELQLSPRKRVLEIGVGTGRLAVKVAPLCSRFTGIDISPKTIERARENLAGYKNIELYLGDFFTHDFNVQYDVVYSSLTFMHIADKQKAISKVADLLTNNGIFVLSIDKNQSDYIDMGTRKLKVFPDDKNSIVEYMNSAFLEVAKVIDTEFAYIIKAINNL